MFRFWLPAVAPWLKLALDLSWYGQTLSLAADSTLGAVCLLPALALCFAACFTLGISGQT